MRQWFTGLLIMLIVLASTACTQSNRTSPSPSSAIDTTARSSSQTTLEGGDRTKTEQNPAESKDVQDTAVPDTNEDSGEIEDFWGINNIEDLAEFFKHIEYSYKTERGEGRVQETRYAFTVLSEEEIDGKTTYHAASVSNASGKENRLEFWIGIEKPALMNGKEVDSFRVMMELPLFFHAFEMSIVWREFVKKEMLRSMYGWKLISEEVKPERIGSQETMVRTYTFETGDGNVLLAAANIGGKAIFTKYRLEKNDEVFVFEILEMVPQEALKE